MKEKFITLPAHFDGNSIILDTPYKLKSNDKLLITVLESTSERDEINEWTSSSLLQLNRAFSEDEVVYSHSLIKEPNPDYKK